MLELLPHKLRNDSDVQEVVPKPRESARELAIKLEEHRLLRKRGSPPARHFGGDSSCAHAEHAGPWTAALGSKAMLLEFDREFARIFAALGRQLLGDGPNRSEALFRQLLEHLCNLPSEFARL